jgi:hypothetical protein
MLFSNSRLLGKHACKFLLQIVVAKGSFGVEIQRQWAQVLPSLPVTSDSVSHFRLFISFTDDIKKFFGPDME